MGKSAYQARLRFYDNDENDKVILEWLKTIPRGAQNCLIKKKLVQAIQMESSVVCSMVAVAGKKQFAEIRVMAETAVPAVEQSKEDVYRHMDHVLKGLEDL